MDKFNIQFDASSIIGDTVERVAKWVRDTEESEVEKKLESLGYVKQKHGQWLQPDYNYSEIAYRKCSECDTHVYLAKWMNYCPECGAKMDGEK